MKETRDDHFWVRIWCSCSLGLISRSAVSQKSFCCRNIRDDSIDAGRSFSPGTCCPIARFQKADASKQRRKMSPESGQCILSKRETGSSTADYGIFWQKKKGECYPSTWLIPYDTRSEWELSKFIVKTDGRSVYHLIGNEHRSSKFRECACDRLYRILSERKSSRYATLNLCFDRKGDWSSYSEWDGSSINYGSDWKAQLRHNSTHSDIPSTQSAHGLRRWQLFHYWESVVRHTDHHWNWAAPQLEWHIASKGQKCRHQSLPNVFLIPSFLFHVQRHSGNENDKMLEAESIFVPGCPEGRKSRNGPNTWTDQNAQRISDKARQWTHKIQNVESLLWFIFASAIFKTEARTGPSEEQGKCFGRPWGPAPTLSGNEYINRAFLGYFDAHDDVLLSRQSNAWNGLH